MISVELGWRLTSGLGIKHGPLTMYAGMISGLHIVES